MKENLFTDLEQMLAPQRQALLTEQPGDWRGAHAQRQSFEVYHLSRPARQTARRRAIYLSRVGELTAAQESVVTATAEYLAVFFDLPVREAQTSIPPLFGPGPSADIPCGDNPNCSPITSSTKCWGWTAPRRP
jgi:hypothetical protein